MLIYEKRFPKYSTFHLVWMPEYEFEKKKEIRREKNV